MLAVPIFLLGLVATPQSATSRHVLSRASSPTCSIESETAETQSGTAPEPAKPPAEPGFFAGFGAAAGLVAAPILLFSVYNVAATGGGLDPGPYGLLGALEGVSYLAVVGIAGAGLVSKASKGTGLPAGPLGLLGLSEGLSFLSLLLAVLVFPLKEFGVVGDPQTAAVDVPALAAAVGEVVSPLVASLVAAVTSAVEQIDLPQVCSSLWPEGHMKDSAHPTTPRPQLTAVRIPTAFAPERWSHPGFPAARGHSTAAVSRTSPR